MLRVFFNIIVSTFFWSTAALPKDHLAAATLQAQTLGSRSKRSSSRLPTISNAKIYAKIVQIQIVWPLQAGSEECFWPSEPNQDTSLIIVQLQNVQPTSCKLQKAWLQAQTNGELEGQHRSASDASDTQRNPKRTHETHIFNRLDEDRRYKKSIQHPILWTQLMDSGLGPLHMFRGHNCKTVRKHESGKRKEHGAIGYCVEANTSNSCGRTRSHARAPLISSQVQQCRIRISNPDLTISSPHSSHPHSSVAAIAKAMVLDPLVWSLPNTSQTSSLGLQHLGL